MSMPPYDRCRVMVDRHKFLEIGAAPDLDADYLVAGETVRTLLNMECVFAGSSTSTDGSTMYLWKGPDYEKAT